MFNSFSAPLVALFCFFIRRLINEITVQIKLIFWLIGLFRTGQSSASLDFKMPIVLLFLKNGLSD